MKRYLKNLLVSFDQLVNAILGGDPDEFLSTRLARGRDTCAACRFVCRVLDWIDAGHCDRSLRSDTSEGKFEVWKW